MNEQLQLDVGIEGLVGEPSPLWVEIGPYAFTADISGALYWPAQETLIVADLHLEKGSSLARRGSLLPPYDTTTTLRLLAAAIARYAPRCVIALGDSFHDPDGASRLTDDDRALLCALQEGRDWLWITGNHDPHLPEEVNGRRSATAAIDGVSFVHEPGASGKTHEIAGHLHPAARLAYRGQTVRRKCFIGDGARAVLPAFGTYAGGLNVLDAAFAPFFARRPFLVWMLGRAQVYPVSRRQLMGD